MRKYVDVSLPVGSSVGSREKGERGSEEQGDWQDSPGGKRGERGLRVCNVEPSKKYLLCSKLKATLGHTHNLVF